MGLITVAGHSFREDLLSDGYIIDIGCRYFDFAKYFYKKNIICVDPDPDVFLHNTPLNDSSNYIQINKAVSNKKGNAFYYRNGESTCLCEVYQPYEHLYTPCETITMEDIYHRISKVSKNEECIVDLLKLDCEGAEYLILGSDAFQSVPKQISVEFHKHLVPEFHEKNIGKVMDNLLKYYDLVYQNETLMDNLFIRKDL